MMQWIISSSVLIAVVIALRFALRGKISLRMQYALWLLVLARLLVPVSFGTSDLSVMNAVPERRIQQSVTIPTENVVTPVAPLVPAQGIDAPLPPDFMQNTTAADTTPKAEKTDWTGIARTVWLTGAVVLGLTFLTSNLRFGRKLRRTRRSIENTGASLPVYESAETETPCLFGLVKPSIYVTPDACADADTLRYALAHEQTHYRHGDHLWAVLRGVCLALHWYNPLVWWAAELSRRDAELACDEATIHALGEAERAAYGRTLIRMTSEKRPALLVTATMMTDSGKGLRERITLLVKKPKTAVYTAVAVLLVACLSVACTFTGSRDSERPYIFENAPVECITLFNSLTGESVTYFDKTDAPEIKALMSHLTKLRQGRKIPQPAPGSTELSIRVVYQDGHTVKCGNDSFSSEGKTYQVLVTSEAANRPALSAWSWEAMWEAYCPKATWDHGFDDDYVLSTMYTIQADSIRNPDDLGENVTAQALADALKIAALNPLTEEEAAAFRAGKADLYCWWIWSVYLEGGPDSFTPDDARLLISCGFPQNIVTVELRKSEQSGTVIVKDPALYQLVRHSSDYKEIIDVAAYQQYCEILEPQMETTFETMNRNGEYSGYILTRFAKAYTYDAPDGRGSVELYYFDYALLLEDAESFTSYVGGMYLDSAERIQGFNGGGMLAVCLQNGSTIYTEFMGNDFWFDGKNIERSEVRKLVDTRLADLLDCALQANQK